MEEDRLREVPAKEMHSTSAYLAHGVYLGLYGFVKHLSFPFFNYPRYAVIRMFAKGIRSSKISDGVVIWFPWRVKIGRKSTLNQGVIIDGFGGVEIGEGVRIAAYAVINTADHAFDDVTRPIHEQGFVVASVKIENDVWIGAGVKINKGVTIGEGSVIGSGAVVTKDIPPYSIAAGVPCKVLRSRR